MSSDSKVIDDVVKGSKGRIDRNIYVLSKEILHNKFSPYYEKSVNEICKELEINILTKNYFQIILSRILGLKDNKLDLIDKFSKENIKTRSLIIEKDGKIKSHMSIEQFKYTEIIKETWEKSKLRDHFAHQKYLFVIYKYDENDVLRLNNVKLWKMPLRVLDTKLKDTWEETVRVIKEGLVIESNGNTTYDNMPGLYFNRVCHTRTLAMNHSDMCLLPDGRMYIKKGFWLNREYILSVIDNEINKIYLDENEVENFQEYNRVCKCDIYGCESNSEYAVFKFNKDSKELSFDNKYICKEHIEEYESNQNNDDKNVINKYLPITKMNTIERFKTASEESKQDYIEAGKDIEPFVKLLMHENLSLPMTIGVFGSWGSGKTFFTNYITDRLKVDKSICIVEFNAWDYYDSDITVSLVSNIFKKVNDIVGGNNEIFSQYQEYKEEKEQEIKQEEEIINSLKEEEATKWNEIIGYVSNDKVKKEIEELRNTYKNIDRTIKKMKKIYFKNIFSIKNVFKQNKDQILKIISISITIVIICMVVIYKLRFNPILITLSICIPLPSMYSRIKKNIKKLQEIVDTIETIEDIRSERKAHEEKEKELKKAMDENLNNKEFYSKIMEEKLNKYKGKVGFIAEIKEDIRELNEIRDNTEIKKIVLVIDDLDRCPSNKVVEVLQSIQLLLSTDMFIVIIGVDTKWINNSISSIYCDILENDDKLFAINYLEKIIHIPFWIEELNNTNSIEFIKRLSEEIGPSEDTVYESDNEDDDIYADDEIASTMDNDGSNEIDTNSTNNVVDINPTDDEIDTNSINNVVDINLTNNDIEILEEMSFLLDKVSPRKIKRFFNIALLIKLRYYSDRDRYKLLLFIAASIILKSEYSCSIYKNIVSIGMEKSEISIHEALEICMKKYKRNYSYRVFLKQYLNYITDNHIENINLKEFIINIKDASRFTYYYEKIFK